MNDLELDVRGVEKRYGPVTALDGVDLQIRRGEIVGLLGHNGAGKTTLVSIIAGLRPADRGTVTVDGIDVAGDRVAASRRIGLAPQDTGLYPTATVRDNLRVFGSLAGLRGRRLRTQVEEITEALDLTEFVDRKTEHLSGGQRRRVHTAAAVLGRPPLLLLDEPTVGADVGTRDALLQVVRSLAANGAAVCYSTHYLPEVEDLDATVAVLERGRLLARGSTQDLITAHATAAVELVFDGPAPLFDGVDCDGSVMRVPTGEPAKTSADLLTGLPAEALARLESIDFRQHDLESAYRALTGGADGVPAGSVTRH